jgi:hypothetical protein
VGTRRGEEERKKEGREDESKEEGITARSACGFARGREDREK